MGDRFKIFSFLWAQAMLFQLASVLWFHANITCNPPTPSGLFELGQLVFCLGLILKPGSIQLLSFAAIFNLADYIYQLPHSPNHRLITAFVNLSFLLCLSVCKLKKKNLTEAIEKEFIPLIRCFIPVIYFFVTFHKLNPDFLNPETSCSAAFYRHIIATLPLAPDDYWVFSSLPYITLIIEGALAFVFLFPLLRPWGLALALCFHSILTLDVVKHFFDFSSTMIAILSLYLNEGFLKNLVSGRPFIKTSIRLPSFNSVRYPAILIYLSAMSFGLFLDSPISTRLFFEIRQLLWWVLNALIIVLFILNFRSLLKESPALRILPRGIWPYMVLAIFTFNGITPYLGLKTRSSFDMYSNLQILAGGSNHFLIKNPPLLLPYATDLVQIRQTNIQSQDELTAGNLRVPFIELKRLYQNTPEAEVTYVHNGEELKASPSEAPEELTKAFTLWQKKLLWYRPVATDGACLW